MIPSKAPSPLLIRQSNKTDSISTPSSTSGFVMLLTLLVLSILILAVTQFAQKSTLHWYFDNTIIEQQKARQLALSGIDIAMSLLAPPQPDESKKDQKPEDPQIYFIKNIVPVLNRWQSYPLKKDLDGIEGSIKICISCEEGKININKLFDFQKHAYIPAKGALDPKKIFGSAMQLLKNYGAKKTLEENADRMLKQRPFSFNDATELAPLTDLTPAQQTLLFYQPPEAPLARDQRSPIALMDIFTVWNDQLEINPLVLSNSLAGMLSLKQVQFNDIEARRPIANEMAKKYKATISLKEAWDNGLQKLYDRELGALNKDLVPLLVPSVRVKTFSVLSYGNIGTSTQRLVAIIQQQGPTTFVVKKLYWI